MLDDEAPLRDGPAAAPRIAAALLAALDATDAATVESFVSMGWHGDAWPRRGGYYVGYLAARRLGEGRAFLARHGEPAGCAGARAPRRRAARDRRCQAAGVLTQRAKRAST